jgi:hypothetical protein
VYTKVDEGDREKRIVRVLGGEEQKVESSRIESRYLWLYYLDGLWKTLDDHMIRLRGRVSFYFDWFR